MVDGLIGLIIRRERARPVRLHVDGFGVERFGVDGLNGLQDVPDGSPVTERSRSHHFPPRSLILP